MNAFCPICEGTETPVYLSGLYDDRYGFPGRFDLHRCQNCQHKFLLAAFSDEQLAQLYSRYYPRSNLDLATWKPHRPLNTFWAWLSREKSAVFRWVPPNCRVLDVGCGFGESLGYHRARGCEVQGVELDDNISRVAQKFGLNAKVGKFQSGDFPSNHFDFVTLDQVIEHSAKPVELLKDACSVLRTGGVLLLSTPNADSLLARFFGRRWVHLHTPYHLQLFSKTSLKRAAETAGMEVLWTKCITNPRWYFFQWLHLLTRPKVGERSIFWAMGERWPIPLRVVRKLLSGAHRLGVDYFVAVALDAFRLGDNFVVALKKKE